MKYGNLNFLETSGPLKVCNLAALPFYSKLTVVKIVYQLNPVHITTAYALKINYKSSLFPLSFHISSEKYFVSISHFPMYVSCLSYLILFIYRVSQNLCHKLLLVIPHT